jgi:hypothetical protein
MTTKEIKEECGSGKWLPILVMRTDEISPIVPVFESSLLANRFVKRNLPANWLCGVVKLTMFDAQLMDSKGWKALKFNYPRKVTDFIDFDIEILEFPSNHKLILNI